MAETWNGETLVFCGRLRRFDVSGGWQTTEYYEGTHEEIAAAEAALSGVNYYADYNTGTPVAKLQVMTPDAGETPTPTEGILSTQFELVNNSEQKHILESPAAIRLGQSNLEDMVFQLKEGTKPSDTVYGGDKRTIYEMLYNGQNAFIVSQWVFKLSQIVTRNVAASVLIARENLNRIYSTAQVVQETNPGRTFTTLLQECRADTLGFYGGTVPAGRSIGWLKTGYSTQNIAQNRMALTIEFWCEAWPVITYPLSSVVVPP